uniref:Uncharacterized protein n=2 Tax=Chenopodium quinoa TaxID=63459 RepID=A0A803MJS0_CHEQI
MEGFIRNIIFYEQSHHYPNDNSYFADYVLFLDELIDTREDVQILVQHGIMENCVGSNDDVATIVNRLTKYISIRRNFYYYDISQRLNAHANAQMNRWMAILRKDYFNHPWSITSVVYLVVILILTVLQVYTGFKS